MDRIVEKLREDIVKAQIERNFYRACAMYWKHKRKGEHSESSFEAGRIFVYRDMLTSIYRLDWQMLRVHEVLLKGDTFTLNYHAQWTVTN